MSETLIWSVASATVSAVAGSLVLRSRRNRAELETNRHEAARLLGWDYQPLDAGFALAGRELGRGWEVIVSDDDVARWSTFTLGAPDIDRAWVAVTQKGEHLMAPENLQVFVVGSPRFTKRHAVWGKDKDQVNRVIDSDIQELLLTWPGSSNWITLKNNPVTIWACPHGVRISVSRPLESWADIQHFVTLGQALALRSGFI